MKENEKNLMANNAKFNISFFLHNLFLGFLAYFTAFLSENLFFRLIAG